MLSARQDGFTLIEMLIAVTLVAVLAAIAYPNLQGAVLKARRVDAITNLLQLQMAQERWRSNHASYAGQAELNPSGESAMRYYALRIADAASSGYTITASGIGIQAGDRACRVLRISVAQGHATHSSGTDEQVANPSADNKRCWNL